MKKINTLSLLALLLLSTLVFSQQKDEVKGQWVFGGNLGVGGGSNGGFGIVVSPEVGYRLNNGLELGGRIGYNYNKNDFYKSSFFNVGPYINYSFVENFFARVQYEFLFGTSKVNSNYSNYTLTNNGDISESALWLGGGYQNSIGNNVRYNLGVMYNVLYDEDKSVYGSGFYPIAGVSFGF